MAQTYPKERMEWIILDDGTDSVEDFFKGLVNKIPNLRYIRLEYKQLIGAKRNILNKEAKGEILVAMDDDDYYCPDRVHHVVQKFISNPTINVAGSSEIYLYYTDIKQIYKFGPYGPNHATNGTMAWRKSYANSNIYDENVSHAEEKSFLNNYKTPILQLDPFKVMLVISHSENTYSKIKMREQESPFVKKTQMKLNQFIKGATLKRFYETA
jgi:cellulose synthase/poly-beta-1,6-N-acetylglucosamine synthase-like glycosyltransferase